MIILITLFGCKRLCNECKNQLNDIILTYKYKSGQVLEYISDSNISRKDTIEITFTPPEKYYACPGDKEGTMSCYSRIVIDIGSFTLRIEQAENYMNNKVSRHVSYRYNSSYFNYSLRDTINVEINNSIVPLKQYKIVTMNNFPSIYCSEIYLTFEDVLYEYYINRNGIVEKWKLKDY